MADAPSKQATGDEDNSDGDVASAWIVLAQHELQIAHCNYFVIVDAYIDAKQCVNDTAAQAAQVGAVACLSIWDSLANGHVELFATICRC